MPYTPTTTIKAGTDDFSKLLLEADVFVDKSLMIKEFLEDSGDVLLITRPRRWGKSLNLDMIARFLAIEVDERGVKLPEEQRSNAKLFLGGEVVAEEKTGGKKILNPLKIAQQCPDLVAAYQGQFPVISLGLKGIKGNTYEKIEEGVKEQITSLYEKYSCMLIRPLLTDYQQKKLTSYLNGQFSITALKDSLRFLTELLHKHFGKPVYVLIDEYDTPINSAYLKFGNKTPEQLEEILELFRDIFGAALKSNPHLKQGLITGILRIAKANLFSDLNNVSEYTLLDKPFSSCYGFTEKEVLTLMKQVPIKSTIEEIRHWYNGYTFGGQEERMYNPWSIMRCLAQGGKLDHYWIDSGGTALIDEALISDDMQKDLQTLVAGGSIIYPIVKQISFRDLNKSRGLYSLLLLSGYLNPTVVDAENYIYELAIPNHEVKYIYETRLLDWVAEKLSIDPGGYYHFISLLAQGRIEAFGEQLQELLHSSTSFHQTGKKQAELFYSGFMLGLLSTLSYSYTIDSERESGMGRPDAVLIPKLGKGEQALIIEYKVSQEAEGLVAIAQAGLAQIEQKGYITKVEDHAQVKSILKVCMAFCGKEVIVVHDKIVLN
jgi:Predicted AAA-ATPase/PD-(D/E)XK nuclease superfamily